MGDGNADCFGSYAPRLTLGTTERRHSIEAEQHKARAIRMGTDYAASSPASSRPSLGSFLTWGRFHAGVPYTKRLSMGGRSQCAETFAQCAARTGAATVCAARLGERWNSIDTTGTRTDDQPQRCDSRTSRAKYKLSTA